MRSRNVAVWPCRSRAIKCLRLSVSYLAHSSANRSISCSALTHQSEAFEQFTTHQPFSQLPQDYHTEPRNQSINDQFSLLIGSDRIDEASDLLHKVFQSFNQSVNQPLYTCINVGVIAHLFNRLVSQSKHDQLNSLWQSWLQCLPTNQSINQSNHSIPLPDGPLMLLLSMNTQIISADEAIQLLYMLNQTSICSLHNLAIQKLIQQLDWKRALYWFDDMISQSDNQIFKVNMKSIRLFFQLVTLMEERVDESNNRSAHKSTIHAVIVSAWDWCVRLNGFDRLSPVNHSILLDCFRKTNNQTRAKQIFTLLINHSIKQPHNQALRRVPVMTSLIACLLHLNMNDEITILMEHSINQQVDPSSSLQNKQSVNQVFDVAMIDWLIKKGLLDELVEYVMMVTSRNQSNNHSKKQTTNQSINQTNKQANLHSNKYSVRQTNMQNNNSRRQINQSDEHFNKQSINQLPVSTWHSVLRALITRGQNDKSQHHLFNQAIMLFEHWKANLSPVKQLTDEPTNPTVKQLIELSDNYPDSSIYSVLLSMPISHSNSQSIERSVDQSGDQTTQVFDGYQAIKELQMFNKLDASFYYLLIKQCMLSDDWQSSVDWLFDCVMEKGFEINETFVKLAIHALISAHNHPTNQRTHLLSEPPNVRLPLHVITAHVWDRYIELQMDQSNTYTNRADRMMKPELKFEWYSAAMISFEQTVDLDRTTKLTDRLSDGSITLPQVAPIYGRIRNVFKVFQASKMINKSVSQMIDDLAEQSMQTEEISDKVYFGHKRFSTDSNS